MQKLNLVAMSYERNAVLNALSLTGAVEIKMQAERENTVPLALDCENLREYALKVENALNLLSAQIEEYNSDNKIKTDVLKDGFSVSYSDFMSAGALKEQADKTVEKIGALEEERKKLLSRQSGLLRTLQTAEIYSALKTPFNNIADTKHVKIKLGTVPSAELDNIKKAVDGNELCSLSVLNKDGENTLVIYAVHKGAEDVLQNFGFSACPFKEGSGESVYAGLLAEKSGISSRLNAVKEEMVALGGDIKILKIYCDYLGFELEKQELSEKFRATNKTFLLEAYVPKEAEEQVKAAIDGLNSSVYYEFSEPADDEIPPTLYKNNKVVKNFETITNMYSPVNSKEFDPNGVMSFFYSLFLGFIMGDIGYGLLMLLGGGFIYIKKRGEDSGLKRLSAVFAIGGIFAILWGILFGSLFGIEIMTPLMPNAQSDMWGLMGINVPAVLIIAMELGVVHLMVGYICKAIQCMRRGYFWDGILDGFVWAVFSIGVGLAIVGFIDEANMPKLAYIGGGIAGVCLVIAMLTAGRKEKLLGKFTKGFGAAYGIINYASDILSYARLYGLMLSGAVIAQIVSSYSIQFITSGNIALIILAAVLMLVGHLFNLAIGLLGAYIHDARLQYVEFYGRFYEGEGELFTPLGSNHKYIKLQNSAKAD